MYAAYIGICRSSYTRPDQFEASLLRRSFSLGKLGGLWKPRAPKPATGKPETGQSRHTVAEFIEFCVNGRTSDVAMHDVESRKLLVDE